MVLSMVLISANKSNSHVTYFILKLNAKFALCRFRIAKSPHIYFYI